ncbi:MAG TPA: PPC domain-containing DNA-binding protein [Casimicrobiaceae bacterium]|nr:PPC domain-containing DNA-binding protein [Casimicrobiaceae bacterium]
MDLMPLRFAPGADLRRALEDTFAASVVKAAFVVAGVGSLSDAALRLAGKDAPGKLDGPLEIVTLAGSLSPDGAHLHACVSDGQGRVFGGHLAYGCVVRTTAEVLVAFLPEWAFAREHDSRTGFRELVVRRD